MAREDAPLARHIENCFPELTVRLGLEDSLRQMMESPAYRAVSKLVDAETAQVAESMSGTRLLEHTEYAQRHGRMGGLRGFQAAAETLLARCEAERREQESQQEAGALAPAER